MWLYLAVPLTVILLLNVLFVVALSRSRDEHADDPARPRGGFVVGATRSPEKLS
jgi:hypothetical protein